jgi:hypothetical protein
MYNVITTDGELYHFGVLGMKWGVRKYQNADGTLTSAGKERYGGKIQNYKSNVEKNLTRTSENADYQQNKAAKLYGKSERNKTRLLFKMEGLGNWQSSRAERAQAKTNKLISKGANYYKKSSKTIKQLDSSESLTQKSITLGEQFVEQQIKNAKSSYYLK